MNIVSNLFSQTDRLIMESVNQRSKRTEIINSNIANAETPGYRSIGYDFEEQLQELRPTHGNLSLKTSDTKHLKQEFIKMDGTIEPDVYLKPTESVSNDGNTVDLEKEMSSLSKNQILYRMAIETLNKKIGQIKYAINGGR